MEDLNPGDVLAKVNNASEGMTLWSDERRKDFVKTFSDRQEAARWILQATASIVWFRALERKFVSNKFADKVVGINAHMQYSYNHAHGSVGGRDVKDLAEIAKERAELILKELPVLKTAVSVIAPDIGKKLERLDGVKKETLVLYTELQDASEPVKLSELDQKMTIGEWRKAIKDAEKRKKKLVNDIEELAEEGAELESAINKALYAGLPGLSDAIVKVVNDLLERSKAMEQLGRRVTERVMFGDSKAAVEILSNFEKDEVSISDNVKAEFATAMSTLKLGAGKKVAKGKK